MDNTNKSDIQSIIDKILDEDDVDSLLVENNSDGIKGAVMNRDKIDVEIDRMEKIESKKDEHQKKLDEATAEQKRSINKFLKKERRWRFFNPILKFFIAIFNINTYVNMVQSFEEFIFVLFINALNLFTLLSISYILLILILSKETDKIEFLYFKIVGCAVIAAICIVAQLYLPSTNKHEGE